MQSILEGVERFQRDVFPKYRQLFERLAGGQNPQALAVTCSDSRIDPNLITQTEPGELFVIRNAGNIVPPQGTDGGEAATIEYALRVLGIRNVLVCGHTDCGAMKALLKPESLDSLPTVRGWLTAAQEARRALDRLPPEADDHKRLRTVTEENVLVQIENLRTHSALRYGLDQGQIHILGAIYEIKSGEFFVYCPRDGRFNPIAEVNVAELWHGD
jgi:carbonic anhydrase